MLARRQAISFLVTCLCATLMGCRSSEEPTSPLAAVKPIPPGPLEPKAPEKTPPPEPEKTVDKTPEKAPEDPTKDWKEYAVGESAVKVKIPPGWTKSVEPNETLVFTMPDDVTVKLRLNDQGYFKVSTINSDTFIRTQSKLKKLPLVERNGKLIVTQTSKWKGGTQTSIATYWFVGFEDRVVVMSLTMFEDKKNVPEVKEFVEKSIPLVIDSLQK